LTQKSLMPVPTDTIPSNEDGRPQALVISAAGELIVQNGNTGTFTVALPCKPTASTVVKTTVIDAGFGLTVTGGSSLTFTTGNYSTPQTVTLTAGAGQAGRFRVMVYASAPVDTPGFAPVTFHVLVS
jgi:hypothetical protein